MDKELPTKGHPPVLFKHSDGCPVYVCFLLYERYSRVVGTPVKIPAQNRNDEPREKANWF
jgi:hypothetical protein